MNLVTGATGIAGSHVLYKLMREGEPVLAGRRSGSALDPVRDLFRFYSGNDDLFKQIRWIETDITDSVGFESLLGDIHTVYHCAGLVSFDPADREKLGLINEKGTATVVNACLARSVAMCHLSSVAAIHNLDYLLPLDEAVFWKKSGKESDYAISKYNAEREVWRGIEEGLRAAIVNPALIIAPGFFNQSSMRLFTRVAQGNRVYTEGLLATVGAVDVADMMVRLMREKRFGQRFIAAENNRTYHQVFTIFAEALGTKAPRIRVGPSLLSAAALAERLISVFSGRKPQLTAAVRASAFNQQKFTAARAAQELHFRFTPLEDLAELAVRAYRSQRISER